MPAPKPTDPKPPSAPIDTSLELPARKKRSPAEVQKDRLTERIHRLENERDDAVRQAIQTIRENAEGELRNRIALKSAAITARFGDRIRPLQTMLGALKNGSE